MPRRYRRRRYAIARPLKTAKYSNETYAGEVHLNTNQLRASMVIVPETQILATRKVKNLTIRLNVAQISFTLHGQATDLSSHDAPFNVLFAAVYVPQGTTPDVLHIANVPTQGTVTTAVSLYEPNQNVIMSGMINPYQPTTVKTRLARNLNSGDQVYLVFLLSYNTLDLDDLNLIIDGTANYAISY